MLLAFQRIHVPSESSASLNEAHVAYLAASLRAQGQLAPIAVAEGGPDGCTHTVVDGAHRMAAWARNGWQDRDISAVLRSERRTRAVHMFTGSGEHAPCGAKITTSRWVRAGRASSDARDVTCPTCMACVARMMRNVRAATRGKLKWSEDVRKNTEIAAKNATIRSKKA